MKYFLLCSFILYCTLLQAKNFESRSHTVSGSVSGIVWHDENINGMIDQGEDVFPQIPVFLFTCTGQFTDAVLTQNDGSFTFSGIPNENYKIFVSTSGINSFYSFTILDPSTDNQVASTGYSDCFSLVDESLEIHAGLAILGSVGDKVWDDLNGNGLQEINEPGIPNVEVELVNVYSSSIIQTTTTTSNGIYLFNNLIPGDYFIRFIPPSGYQKTIINSSDTHINSNITDANGDFTTDAFNLSPTANVFDLDAGFYRCAKICGIIYYDGNVSDSIDSEENGVNGLEVRLWKIDGQDSIIFDTKITAHQPDSPSNDGYYEFCVPPGIYYSEVVINSITHLMPGLPFATSNPDTYNHYFLSGSRLITNHRVLKSGDNFCHINTGLFCPAYISGVVWLDSSQDGLRENTEVVMSGITAHLCYPDGSVVAHTLTDESGFCFFDQVRPGEYFIKYFSVPALTFTTPFAGIQTVDSDVTGAFGDGTTNFFILGPCDTMRNIDAGTTYAVLPVFWKDISVKSTATSNLVSWTVASEINVSHYLIAKYEHENNQWRECGEVAAFGFSKERSYSYEDLATESGQNIYKIIAVDFDGKRQVSPLASVFRTERQAELKISPNPASESVVISIPDTGMIRIYNSIGKIVGEYSFNKGQSEINVQNFPQGSYRAILFVDGKVVSSQAFNVVK